MFLCLQQCVNYLSSSSFNTQNSLPLGTHPATLTLQNAEPKRRPTRKARYEGGLFKIVFKQYFTVCSYTSNTLELLYCIICTLSYRNYLPQSTINYRSVIVWIKYMLFMHMKRVLYMDTCTCLMLFCQTAACSPAPRTERTPRTPRTDFGNDDWHRNKIITQICM